MTQADRRIADLRTVVARLPHETAEATDEYIAAVARVDDALAQVLAQQITPARAAAIARAAAASEDHIAALAALAALATRLPAEAQAGIQRAIDVQQAVHGHAEGTPGRPQSPRPSDAPGGARAPTTAPGRPSGTPGGRPSDRGGLPSAAPTHR